MKLHDGTFDNETELFDILVDKFDQANDAVLFAALEAGDDETAAVAAARSRAQRASSGKASSTLQEQAAMLQMASEVDSAAVIRKELDALAPAFPTPFNQPSAGSHAHRYYGGFALPEIRCQT